MEFVIYALLLAAGFIPGYFYGRSKKSDPAPIVIEPVAKAAPKAKRAYVRKAPKKATSAEATVNVSKALDPTNAVRSIPNGRLGGDNYLPSSLQQKGE